MWILRIDSGLHPAEGRNNIPIIIPSSNKSYYFLDNTNNNDSNTQVKYNWLKIEWLY